MTHNTPEHNTTQDTTPEHNTTLHDLYRKECAKLFTHTPGTSTISTLREIRGYEL